MNLKSTGLFKKEILEFKNNEVTKEGKSSANIHQELILTIKQPEIIEEFYYQLFRICNFRVCSFLS